MKNRLPLERVGPRVTVETRATCLGCRHFTRGARSGKCAETGRPVMTGPLEPPTPAWCHHMPRPANLDELLAAWRERSAKLGERPERSEFDNGQEYATDRCIDDLESLVIAHESAMEASS